jgi:hypothetical protein
MIWMQLVLPGLEYLAVDPDPGPTGPPSGDPLPDACYCRQPTYWVELLLSGALREDLQWYYGATLLGSKILRRGRTWNLTLYVMLKGVEHIYFLKDESLEVLNDTFRQRLQSRTLGFVQSRFPHSF